MPTVIGPRTFLAYRDYLALKISLGVLAVSVVAYLIHDPFNGPSGGSWLGYTLGTIASLMIVWLMWFGVRKRNYVSPGLPLQAWLSGHVYLGGILVVLVPLHSGFQFGWNVHTLAYALMCGVIVSGFVGVYAYSVVPTLMTRNRPGQRLEALFQQVADVDAECKLLATGLPDHMAASVAMAVDETEIGGGILHQVAADASGCATSRALVELRAFGSEVQFDTDRRTKVRKLLELLSLKQAQLVRIRRDIRLKALVDLWLLVHVPLAFATVAAVLIHIFVVFYYW